MLTKLLRRCFLFMRPQRVFLVVSMIKTNVWKIYPVYRTPAYIEIDSSLIKIFSMKATPTKIPSSSYNSLTLANMLEAP